MPNGPVRLSDGGSHWNSTGNVVSTDTRSAEVMAHVVLPQKDGSAAPIALALMPEQFQAYLQGVAGELNYRLEFASTRPASTHRPISTPIAA